MTLTQQFLIISILPLSFLLMIVYLWSSKLKRGQLFGRWSLTLLAAAVWASSVLRYFGGVDFSSALTQSWGVVGKYALSFTALGILLTTLCLLSVPRRYGRAAGGVSLLLLLLALGLDRSIWPYTLPDFMLAGQVVSHFDLWAAVWIASWLEPVIAAWILAQQASVSVPQSLYRNQVHYWLLVLFLFFVGGALASVHQPGQSGWQQGGVLVVFLAAFTGTISIAHSHLPELQLALRQIANRISGTLIIFGLTWLALSFIVRVITDRPAGSPATGQELILLLAAAAFAVFFSLIYRLVNDLTRRLFLPGLGRREMVMSDYTNAIGNLPEPAQLGQLFLRIVQTTLVTDDAWFYTAEDGPAGKLILRPLAGLGSEPKETLDFEYDSPFALYLRQQPKPLVQYDIDTVGAFAKLSESEKSLLARLQRVLFMPLHAGNSLVGVLALGAKYTGESYDRRDFDLLQSLSEQSSPLLAQTQNLATLRQINDYVFRQNQIVAREKQHLRELSDLYAQFIQLISPDLRRPFVAINQQLQQLQEKAGEIDSNQSAEELSRHIAALKNPIDNLITLAARIQMRSGFDFELVRLDEITTSAIRNLRTMAEARRVKVEFNPDRTLPAVLGDEGQLLEAVQHLLHNAIKFNKIGGVVQLDCGIDGGNLYLHIVDTGVGIPDERLSKIWTGFRGLSQNGSNRGAGLGLALTRFIISAHGGSVQAQSKYGSGSVFSIHLPLVFED